MERKCNALHVPHTELLYRWDSFIRLQCRFTFRNNHSVECRMGSLAKSCLLFTKLDNHFQSLFNIHFVWSWWSAAQADETKTKNDNIVSAIVAFKGNKDESNYLHPAKNTSWNIVVDFILSFSNALSWWTVTVICSAVCFVPRTHFQLVAFFVRKPVPIGDENVHKTNSKARQTTPKALTTKIRKRILSYALHSPPFNHLNIYCSCRCLFR